MLLRNTFKHIFEVHKFVHQKIIEIVQKKKIQLTFYLTLECKLKTNKQKTITQRKQNAYLKQNKNTHI